MKKYCRPNKKLVNHFSKSFTSTGNYAFYLLLTTVHKFGYIPNFKSAIKQLRIKYNFSTNTGKSKIKTLESLGWVKYDPTKDILYIKSQDKIFVEENIGKGFFQIDISLIDTDFKKLKYKLNAQALKHKQSNKLYSVKQQLKNGKYKVANYNVELSKQKYNWVHGTSRKEVASVYNSKWSSTGSKKIKRLKQFDLINSDSERDNIVLVENTNYKYYINMLTHGEYRTKLFYKKGKIFIKQSNLIKIKHQGIKIYDKI